MLLDTNSFLSSFFHTINHHHPTMLSRTLRAPHLPLLRTSLTHPSRPFTTTHPRLKIYPNVTPTTFQSLVLHPSPTHTQTLILVDFYATWCQPCKLLSPSLEKIATDPTIVGGKLVDLVTVDVDRNQQLAQQFKVSAMPTVLAMKDGKVIDGFVGMLPEKKLIEFVKNLK